MLSTLLIGVLSIAVGAFLLKRAWWPRRIGDTPHCSRCDYILSGDQRRCPECGAVADMESVVRGSPSQSRHGGDRAVSGLLGVAILLLVVTRLLVFTVDWNRHKPLGWLLRDLGTTHGAWDEIQRRLDNNVLSDSDQNAVVERGLQVQDVQSGNITNESILDYIGSRYLDHKLTSSQADRSFDTLLKAKLSVRPVVGA